MSEDHPEVINLCTFNINSDLIDAAKDECDGLDLDTTASFKAFVPGKNCEEIIKSVKQQVRMFMFGINIDTAEAYVLIEPKKGGST